MQVSVREWEMFRDNPLTPEETENVLAEAEIHARIPKEKYQGQAEGMKDIAEQYGTEVGKDEFYKSFLIVKEGKGYSAVDVSGKKHGPVKSLKLLKTFIDQFISRFKFHDKLNPRKEVSYEEASRLIKQILKSGNIELANQLIAYYERKKIIPKVKLVKQNPPPHIVGKIYERILEIRASKAGMPHHCDAACKAAGHRYKHPFKQKACVYALSDGTFLVK